MNAYERSQQAIEAVVHRFDDLIDQGLGYNRAVDHVSQFYGIPRDRVVAVLLEAVPSGIVRNADALCEAFGPCPDCIPDGLLDSSAP